MTSLTKRVQRMSETVIRDGGKRRRLVVALNANDTIGIRPEGTRSKREELITIEAVYWMAIKARIARDKRDKQQAKKKRKEEQ